MRAIGSGATPAILVVAMVAHPLSKHERNDSYFCVVLLVLVRAVLNQRLFLLQIDRGLQTRLIDLDLSVALHSRLSSLFILSMLFEN